MSTTSEEQVHNDIDKELADLTERLEQLNPQFAQAVQIYTTANEWYRAGVNALYFPHTFGTGSANATLLLERR